MKPKKCSFVIFCAIKNAKQGQGQYWSSGIRFRDVNCFLLQISRYIYYMPVYLVFLQVAPRGPNLPGFT